jgi:LacI family transcriptional regulator
VKRKLSINDIAKQLDISITTVSFILNGRAKEKRISDELVKKVLKFVEEVGYKPSSLARSLRTGKTNIIGLMVEDISDPFFSSVARQIEENAYKNGYKILYCSTENDTEKTKDLIQMFRDRHVDGYIIAPPEGIEEEIKSLMAIGKPVVLFDRFLPSIPTDYVVTDNRESTYKAVQHLIDNGYKNIAFITLDSLQPQMQERLLGYERAIGENKLPQYVKEISFQDTEKAIRQITMFLERKKELDAILFSTNYLCVSGLKAINRMGLKIPQDLAIACFDDYELFELYSPTITAVSQPIEQLSEQVINILLSKLNAPFPQKEKEYQKVVVPSTFIVRNSSVKK